MVRKFAHRLLQRGFPQGVIDVAVAGVSYADRQRCLAGGRPGQCHGPGGHARRQPVQPAGPPASARCSSRSSSRGSTPWRCSRGSSTSGGGGASASGTRSGGSSTSGGGNAAGDAAPGGAQQVTQPARAAAAENELAAAPAPADPAGVVPAAAFATSAPRLPGAPCWGGPGLLGNGRSGKDGCAP